MRLVDLSKRVVILGAGGFIGRNLATALAKEDCELICFDRVRSPSWPKEARYVAGDFADMPRDLLSELENATVFHLVSSCRPTQFTETASDELLADAATTVRYLEQTRAKDVRWVFVSSGGTVYGPDAQCPTQEDSPTRPICSYGLVKLTIESYFALYGRIHGTDFVVARMSNPYGPWQNPRGGQGIIAALIYRALTGQSLEIWGDGENVRDYIYVEDAVDGLIAAACGLGGETYNIGTGLGTTVNELATIIAKVLGVGISLEYKESRSVDVRKSILDSRKLSRMSNWRPETNLEEGIAKTMSWIKSAMTERLVEFDRAEE